ncbi:hypothetical protein ACHHYP_16594 [Achlya hypogyna]|uniref:HTH CENPB-type domain-containing protein n=1 Tax=Achlya hypogyna TaxID=1202772 RepID=A0A1V9ZE29_ACHHY|nr:hypothetical protein ACHHYP_16594 [Achlya hypogyna]
MRKKRYDPKDLVKAVDMYLSGKRMKLVRQVFPNIPDRTIFDRARKVVHDIPLLRPGPKPALTVPIEEDLEAWIVAMQCKALGVSRARLLIKANELYRTVRPTTRATTNLGRGWIYRFFKRFPHLTLRASQLIKRARAEATQEGLTLLHCELTQHVIERKLSADRIFNMDETGYSQSSKSRKVVAVSGSRNVWGHVMEMSFHCTIVAAASASGFVVPPLFLVPGLRLQRDLLDACVVDGAVVGVTLKGFMNAISFRLWLVHFEASIPSEVARPVVLVYDGYSSHYDQDIVRVALRLKVILVLLPSNSTHLVQPLDVAIFGPYKRILRKLTQDFMVDTATVNLTKRDAIGIASRAWEEGVVAKRRNAVSGFRTCGLWPLNFPAMQARLALFKNGGIGPKTKKKRGIEVAPWIRELVRAEILTLPAPIDRTSKRRKTLDSKERLFTREMLNTLDI